MVVEGYPMCRGWGQGQVCSVCVQRRGVWGCAPHTTPRTAPLFWHATLNTLLPSAWPGQGLRVIHPAPPVSLPPSFPSPPSSVGLGAALPRSTPDMRACTHGHAHTCAETLDHSLHTHPLTPPSIAPCLLSPPLPPLTCRSSAVCWQSSATLHTTPSSPSTATARCRLRCSCTTSPTSPPHSPLRCSSRP